MGSPIESPTEGPCSGPKAPFGCEKLPGCGFHKDKCVECTDITKIHQCIAANCGFKGGKRCVACNTITKKEDCVKLPGCSFYSNECRPCMIRTNGPECKRSKCAYVKQNRKNKCIACNTMKDRAKCLRKNNRGWCAFTKGKCVFKPKD